MTILQALNSYYDRMAARGEAEAPGFSREKISYAIVLSPDGDPVDVQDVRDVSGKKPKPRLMDVPAAIKRTVGIAPNRLWDKTAYVLGRTAGEGKRTAEEHAAFKALHAVLLAGSNDAGLVALRRFLETWTPDRFDAAPFTTEMADANFVFRLDGDDRYLHQREAAQRLLNAPGRTGDAAAAVCLITGEMAPVRRLHPSIKGVEGAQSSGAALVSFNLDAFTSYGKEQGANAPTSEAAAERYGAALNRMLDRGSRNRLARPVGGTSLVFWADASALKQKPEAETEAIAEAAEDWFGEMFGGESQDTERLEDDKAEAGKLRGALQSFADERPVERLDPDIAQGVRFHVLGLAPNAARLSVRLWLEDSFVHFEERLRQHYDDLDIQPRPWRGRPPSVQRLLVKTTALQEKFDNIPEFLAGEVMRAILSGANYPLSWLSAAITRLRAGDDPATGWHAAAIRAVLMRKKRNSLDPRSRAEFNPAEEGLPVTLQKDNKDPAYQLGRLFAAFETAQRLALGKVNATIRDRYFGAASATPASVFPLLLRGAQNHLGKLRKDNKGGWLEREIEEIIDRLGVTLPKTLALEKQGRFAIGYYHQRKGQFAGRPAGETEEEGDDNGEE